MSGIRARQRAERPKQILSAAFDEFVARGYAAARLDDVAARIGVTKGTIYFYFSSKEEVFEAALKAVADQSWAEVSQRELRSTGDLIEDIRVFLQDISSLIIENRRSRESFRLLVAEGDRFPHLVERYFHSFMGPIEELLQARLSRAAGDGELRPGLDHLAQVILSPPLALQVMLLLFPERLHVDRAAFLRSHIDVLAAGILSPSDNATEGPASAGALHVSAPSVDLASTWSEWRRFPDPRRGEMLTAPLGPGLYELRLTSGELLTIAAARHVASHLTAIAPRNAKAGARQSNSDAGYLLRHMNSIEYRSMPRSSYSAAQRLLRATDRSIYRFPA